MDKRKDSATLSPERLERALVMAAKIARLLENEFDCGPMLDLLQTELDKSRTNDPGAKARAILARYGK